MPIGREADDIERFAECCSISAEVECRSEGSRHFDRHCRGVGGRNQAEESEKVVNESLSTELQFWQSRTDDLQVTADRLRDERNELRDERDKLLDLLDSTARDLAMYRGMVDRMRIAMSQGAEL